MCAENIQLMSKGARAEDQVLKDLGEETARILGFHSKIIWADRDRNTNRDNLLDLKKVSIFKCIGIGINCQ